MKHKLRIVAAILLSIYIIAFKSEAALLPQSQLPVELKLNIIRNLSTADLFMLGTLNQEWRGTIRMVIASESDPLDLSEFHINENQFQTLFQEHGFLHLAKNITLSHLNFQGHWIDFLPTENLQPRENGAARLNVRTSTGAVFEYVGRHTNLGHAWRDPNHLIWFSSITRLSYEDAVKYCSAYEARLPSASQWRNFSQFLGWNEGHVQNENYYTPQILADLDRWYWVVSDNENAQGTTAPVFNALNGRIFNTSQSHLKAVRCVL